MPKGIKSKDLWCPNSRSSHPCRKSLGADMVGMVFAPSSRQITIEQGKLIASAARSVRNNDGNNDVYQRMIQKCEVEKTNNITTKWFHDHISMVESTSQPLLVGVFQNQPLNKVISIADSVPLDLVQLHGEEPFDYVDQVPFPVIKVFHVGQDFFDQELDQVKDLSSPNHHAFILLDTKVPGAAHQGGKGVTFDWGIAKKVKEMTGLPIMMAGVD